MEKRIGIAFKTLSPFFIVCAIALFVSRKHRARRITDDKLGTISKAYTKGLLYLGFLEMLSPPPGEKAAVPDPLLISRALRQCEAGLTVSFTGRTHYILILTGLCSFLPEALYLPVIRSLIKLSATITRAMEQGSTTAGLNVSESSDYPSVVNNHSGKASCHGRKPVETRRAV